MFYSSCSIYWENNHAGWLAEPSDAYPNVRSDRFQIRRSETFFDHFYLLKTFSFLVTTAILDEGRECRISFWRIIRNRNCLPFASTWLHPGFFGGFRVAHLLVSSVVLVCVFTFQVLCCDVRYNFCIKTMFGSSLSPVVCRMAHVLFTLFVFDCA